MGIAARGAPIVELLLGRREWHPDPDDGLFPAAYAVPEVQPRLEPGHPGRVGHGHGDQELIHRAVGGESGTRGQPPVPSVGAAQLLDCLAGERAVLSAALGPLLVGESPARVVVLACGHRCSPCRVAGPSGRRAVSPTPRRPQGATIGEGDGRPPGAHVNAGSSARGDPADGGAALPLSAADWAQPGGRVLAAVQPSLEVPVPWPERCEHQADPVGYGGCDQLACRGLEVDQVDGSPLGYRGPPIVSWAPGGGPVPPRSRASARATIRDGDGPAPTGPGDCPSVLQSR